MEILRTWFGSGLAWATPALVLLGALAVDEKRHLLISLGLACMARDVSERGFTRSASVLRRTS